MSTAHPSTSAQASPDPHELPKAYVPAEHEGRIRARWESSGAFHADPARVLSGQAKPYCIFIPPPNVTGALHLGHALNNTLQDMLARAHRMMGFETLWMPGTDHAGIATQAVVERRLRQEGKLRGPLRDAERNGGWTRETFVAQVRVWKDEYEARITGQLKAMGCSCDFARQRFTMDEQCARAVYEAFFRLFKDGLIYRGKRLVNWDPALQTAVADDECYDEEIDGSFYYLRYPLVEAVTLADGTRVDHITVATTRPETYLGDTAVAVNPKDPRAGALVGKSVRLPLVGRVIPIIADDYVVLPEALATSDEERNDPKAKMATGFLKVTPAHDQNDYELGQRHKDAIEAAGNPVLINIFAPDATISDKHGWSDVNDARPFVGKKREEARKLVVEEFKRLGLFEGSKPHRHSVKHSDRSKAIVEPYLSDQWYVKVTDPRLAASANAALVPEQRTAAPSGEGKGTVGPTPPRPSPQGGGDSSLRFYPARYAKTYEQWHENIRDWCISRQLWWGHQIPVWSKTCQAGDVDNAFHELDVILPDALEDVLDGNGADCAVHFVDAASGARFVPTLTEFNHGFERPTRVYVTLRHERGPANNRETSKALESEGWQRDPDVLDTWFSSALWPLSTLAWPEDTDLLRAFNPSSLLSTAREIITLWVSRMVMFNRYLHGAGNGDGPVPFRDVFIHAVVQDGHGKRMSKSAGNGVDPLDIISSHGADAMRFTLCQMTTQTQDVRLPVVKDPKTGTNTSPKFDLGRNLCNKLWNAARYAMGILNQGEVSGASAAIRPAAAASLSLPDRWLLSRVAAGVAEANAALAQYQFSEYAQGLYDLLWRDFCDWYLEAIKPTVASDANQRAVLANALHTIVRLLHPIAPFVTEAIWERLRDVAAPTIEGVTLAPSRRENLLCTAGWPEVSAAWRDEGAEREFERLRSLISAIREVRSQHTVPPKRKIALHLPARLHAEFAPHATLLATLAGLSGIGVIGAPAAGAVAFTFESVECQLSDLADAQSLDSGAERARLEKAIVDSERTIKTLEGRLANPGYADKAPAHMVQQTKDQLARAIADRDAARAALGRLG